MKKVLTFVGKIAVTSALSIIIYSFLLEDDSSGSERKVKTKLYSNILDEEREVIVHLPLDYDSTKKYPVMYVLDGGSQDDHIATKFDVLSSAGYSPKTIVVGIPNMSAINRELNLTPPFIRSNNDDPNSDLGDGDKFLKFMESELFPFIEGQFAASQTRLLSGNSRGGLLVMYSLLYSPDLFQARFCYTTPFWRQDNILALKVTELLHSTDTLTTFLYMSAGENETDNIKNGLDKMKERLKDNAPAGFIFYADYTPHAIHQNNAMISSSIGIARWSEHYKLTNRN